MLIQLLFGTSNVEVDQKFTRRRHSFASHLLFARHSNCLRVNRSSKDTRHNTIDGLKSHNSNNSHNNNYNNSHKNYNNNSYVFRNFGAEVKVKVKVTRD